MEQQKNQNQKDSQKKQFSRRKFLSLLAGAGVLVCGGSIFFGKDLFPGHVGKAARLITGELDVDYLRQVVAEDNTHKRTIMWQSGTPLSAPFVEWKKEGANDSTIQTVNVEPLSFTDDDVTVTIYSAHLDELPEGESLLYRVCDGAQATSWTPLHTDDGGEFSALIFPDSQSSDYSDWASLAAGARERNQDASLVINTGDLVDNGQDHTQWNQWFDGLSQSLPVIPFAPLMGNHETYNLSWKVRKPYAYLAEFDVPANGSNDYSRYWYSFDFGPCHFTVLNTQNEEVKEAGQSAEEFLAEQKAWFLKDVAATKKKWKIVLMHKDALQYRFQNRSDRKEGFSDEGKFWMPLFDETSIDVVFSGHLHTYRNRGHIKNFQRSQDGPLYILTGVAGNVRYPGLWTDHALDLVVAPQPETDNYVTLHAKEGALLIKAFLPDGKEIDSVTVEK